ncbi:hypothetical protein D3C84_276860 [compost metagenome]
MDHPALPGLCHLHQVQARLAEIDTWVSGLRMQGRRQHAVLHLEQDLAQPSDPRRALGMAYIGLHRPQGTGLSGFTRLPVGAHHALDFDRVAQRGSRTVGFDISHILWGNGGPLKGLADHLGLGPRARHGVA